MKNKKVAISTVKEKAKQTLMEFGVEDPLLSRILRNSKLKGVALVTDSGDQGDVAAMCVFFSGRGPLKYIIREKVIYIEGGQRVPKFVFSLMTERKGRVTFPALFRRVQMAPKSSHHKQRERQAKAERRSRTQTHY